MCATLNQRSKVDNQPTLSTLLCPLSTNHPQLDNGCSLVDNQHGKLDNKNPLFVMLSKLEIISNF